MYLPLPGSGFDGSTVPGSRGSALGIPSLDKSHSHPILRLGKENFGEQADTEMGREQENLCFFNKFFFNSFSKTPAEWKQCLAEVKPYVYFAQLEHYEYLL